MDRMDVYKVAAAAALLLATSWVCSVETLLVLGMIAAAVPAVIFLAAIGVMAVSERVSAEFARDRAETWRKVDARATVPHR